MPVNFTMPPDTRAAGTPDPANDMNAVVDALTAQGAPLNVLSAAFAGGADPTGASDSTAAIKAALAAAPLGAAVTVPGAYWNGSAWAQATYKTTSPLVVPPGVTLVTTGHSLAYYGGSTAMPLSGAIIAPSASFAAATVGGQAVNGVIALVSQNLGGYATGSGNQAIQGITIDGRSAPAGTNGVEAWGPVWGVTFRDVGVYGVPNFGVATSSSTADGTGKAPDLWNVQRTHIAACGSDGWNVNAGLSDSYFVACESTGNGGTGWNMTGGNTRMVGCKAEFNTAFGYRIIAPGTGGAGAMGYMLNGCSTDHNGQDGILVYGSNGAGPVCLDGCTFHGDGYQAGAGGGGFAGVRVSAVSGRVLCTGLRVLTASGATPFPQYGVRNDGSASVVKVSGASLVYGNTAAVNNTSTGTVATGADVLTGTGTWGS